MTKAELINKLTAIKEHLIGMVDLAIDFGGIGYKPKKLWFDTCREDCDKLIELIDQLEKENANVPSRQHHVD